MKTNIPIYRAKKIDSDKYVEGTGFYKGVFEDKAMCLGNCRIQNIIIERGTMWHIDPSTLAIHFPDMIDIDGTKIFASLSEDGKGGGTFLKNFFYVVLFHKGAVRFLSHHGDINSTISNKDIKVTGIQE